MVRQVAQERHGASVTDDPVGGAVPVVRLVGASHVNGGVDDVKKMCIRDRVRSGWKSVLPEVGNGGNIPPL